MTKGRSCRWVWLVAAVALAATVAGAGYWWWRAPKHGGVVFITGRLPEPYVLDGGVFVRVNRRSPECTAFKLQNPMPKSDGFGVEFERRDRNRYRARIDLRDAPIGGGCDWQAYRLAVGVYPRRVLSRGETVLRLTAPVASPPGDDRPWWNGGPTKVHCVRRGEALECSDAVDAIYDIPSEGEYQLDIEIVDASAGDAH